MGKFFVLICLLTQVLTREVLVYFDRSELQFVWQETMTELRFVWPFNVTGHYSKIISSTDFTTFLFT